MDGVLVLGRGFLGRAFERYGFRVLGRDEFDADDPDLEKLVEDCHTIVNCIGKANTRWCEHHFKEAYFANAIVPARLSDYCHKAQKRFVHISTGCLYDREYPTVNTECQMLAAHCNYTVTKFAAERMCQPDDLIIRPRLLFGVEDNDKNLLCRLEKFENYISDPNSYTSTDVVVAAVTQLLKQKATGVFNVACEGPLALYQLASLLGFEGGRIEIDKLRSRDHIWLVNNVMCLDKLKFYYKPPALEDEVQRCWRAIIQEREKNAAV